MLPNALDATSDLVELSRVESYFCAKLPRVRSSGIGIDVDAKTHMATTVRRHFETQLAFERFPDLLALPTRPVPRGVCEQLDDAG